MLKTPVLDADGDPLKGVGGVGKGKYSHLTDSPTVGPGKIFTRSQKEKLINKI